MKLEIEISEENEARVLAAHNAENADELRDYIILQLKAKTVDFEAQKAAEAAQEAARNAGKDFEL